MTFSVSDQVLLRLLSGDKIAMKPGSASVGDKGVMMVLPSGEKVFLNSGNVSVGDKGVMMVLPSGEKAFIPIDAASVNVLNYPYDNGAEDRNIGSGEDWYVSLQVQAGGYPGRCESSWEDTIAPPGSGYDGDDTYGLKCMAWANQTFSGMWGPYVSYGSQISGAFDYFDFWAKWEFPLVNAGVPSFWLSLKSGGDWVYCPLNAGEYEGETSDWVHFEMYPEDFTGGNSLDTSKQYTPWWETYVSPPGQTGSGESTEMWFVLLDPKCYV